MIRGFLFLAALAALGTKFLQVSPGVMGHRELGIMSNSGLLLLLLCGSLP